jgi:hypothetical protein
MTKIYDCFTFYNELDLLEIRLQELYNIIDHFVIVESNQTFTNRAKPFLFEENKSRYSRYLDKIIHVKVEDMPGSANAWDNERHQRNAILRGISTATKNDIIIVSDCDEILRAQAVAHLRNSGNTLFGLRMPLFNFKFNYMRATPNHYDIWAMAARKELLDDWTPDTLRGMRFNFTHLGHQVQWNGLEMIEHAGWHFGYLGDNEYLKDKAQSFSHTEVNTSEFLEQIDIEASIRERKEWDRKQSHQYAIVELDNYFPEYLIKNKDKYSNYILDNSESTVYNILQ